MIGAVKFGKRADPGSNKKEPMAKSQPLFENNVDGWTLHSKRSHIISVIV